MATKNITVKVDAEVYRRARIRAAERGTSVSAMVREFLEGIDAHDQESEEARDLQRRKLLETIGAASDALPRTKHPATMSSQDEFYDEAHAKRIASLRELYRAADSRAAERSEPLTPLTRDEIYRERLR